MWASVKFAGSKLPYLHYIGRKALSDVDVIRLLGSGVAFISAASFYLICINKLASYYAPAAEGYRIVTFQGCGHKHNL